MVRKLPTTMALAYAQPDENGVVVHVLWAGDSRVYLLDEQGLAQLTLDDNDVEDAFENLYDDGVLNNVISSDGNYKINYKRIHIDRPAMILTATDGCFSYFTSPMEFEFAYLKTLIDSKTPEAFEKALNDCLKEYAGDDLAMGIMSFFFGDYGNTRKLLNKRLEYVKKKYIDVIDKEERNEATLRNLWNEYKPNYERLLK